MIWSELVLGFQTNIVVWIDLAWYSLFLFAVHSHSPLDLLPTGAASLTCQSSPSDALSWLEQLQQIDFPFFLFLSYKRIPYYNFSLLGRCAPAD